MKARRLISRSNLACLPDLVARLLLSEASNPPTPRPPALHPSLACTPSLRHGSFHCNHLPSSFPCCPHLLAAADLFPSLPFLPCFCIYFGNLPRQTKHHRLAVSCILSSTFAQSLLSTRISRICSIYLHVLPSAIMSFNITSSGSPTPRKGAPRFSKPGNLRLDTSQETLGQAGGAVSQNHFPFAMSRPFGVSLTSHMQGVKRPLGSSALGNQSMLPRQSSFEAYKVSKLSLMHPGKANQRCRLDFSLDLSILPATVPKQNAQANTCPSSRRILPMNPIPWTHF